jgi:putative membrane-bound dehydrogenase-like protein
VLSSHRFSGRAGFILGLIGSAALIGSAGLESVCAEPVASPLEPFESLKHFQLDAGVAIELAACEPAVVDPIAMRFDEDGRLWVVEMRDYPNGPTQGKAPLSRICQLIDIDGDGRYESSQVFADELLFPTGLQPWQGGLIVTLAGQVVYLKDTDGDGRADSKEVWFQGFTAENPQLRANHPRLGLDNRVYIANGLRGGVVSDPRRKEQEPLAISGMDFCFDPHSGDCQAVSGNGQFGLSFDNFGNRFVCNNRAPLDHVVLESRYLARNPLLAVPTVLANVAAGGEQSRVYPLTDAWTTSNLHAGQFTAACGVEIYRGGALGKDFDVSAFVCEPTGSLVHREVVTDSGVTFASKSADEGREFLATPDAWFRPVNLEVGPDGALYVVDMYRAVIEHPQFMPSELQNRADMRLGDDRGRIYRIVPAGKRTRSLKPALSKATSAQLVELLRHENGWWRDTAARLLYERQEATSKPALELVATTAPEAVARVHALWALDGLKALDPQIAAGRLADENPRVREQAVALVELQHAGRAMPDVLLKLAADADARVRFRTALALGNRSDDAAVEALLSIALVCPDDVWTRRAVSTAVPQAVGKLLLAALRSPRIRRATFDAPELLLVSELATQVGSKRDATEIDGVLAIIVQSVQSSDATAVCECALGGIARGLERRGTSLAAFVDEKLGQDASLKKQLQVIFDRVADEAHDTARSTDERATKIDLLRYADSPRAAATLAQIVAQDPMQSLRVRAATALAAYGDETTSAALLASFTAQTPTVRRAILDALVAKGDSAGRLLDAIEAGDIPRGELDATRENALRKHADATVRTRAPKLLVATVPAERKRVLEEYQACLTLPADPRAGRELFRQHCATCHHIAGVGVNVAPDISDSRVKTPAQLLTDILHPNQAIDNNYVSYTVVASGVVYTGLIASETASSITLRQPENKSLDLLRADIESVQSTGVSLMPEGFEKHLSQRQMADLISFIKNWRYLDQPIPTTIDPAMK